MQVSRDQAVKLFEAVGFAKAGSWSPTRMSQKIEKLPTLVGEDLDVIEDEEMRELASQIVEAINSEEDVEVTAKAAKAAPKKTTTTKKKPTKKKPPVEEVEEDEEDEEEEDEDDEEDELEEDEEEEVTTKKKVTKKKPSAAKSASTKKKTTKKKASATKKKTTKKKAPANAKPKKPGVIASIAEFLAAASEKKPLSKEALLKKLANRFKDREPEQMATTIRSQLASNRLAKEKGLDVRKDDKGRYWIVS